MCNCAALFFVLFSGVCYGFILTSSTNTGPSAITEGKYFKPGKSWNYKYTTRVNFNEKGSHKNDVGFLIGSEVLIESVWGYKHSRILKVSLKTPQFFIQPKSSETTRFVSHSSNLETITNEPFFIIWNNGVVEKVLFRKEEEIPMVNLKKGVASLLQFQFLEQEKDELDTSGNCKVLYILLTPKKLKKTKLKCTNEDLPLISNAELLLSTKLRSLRTGDYELDAGGEYLETIKYDEIHEMYLPAKEGVGNKVEMYQRLDFIETKSCDVINLSTYEEVKQKLIDDLGLLKEESLLSEIEPVRKDEAKSFVAMVNQYRENLKVTHLGKLSSAKASIPLITTARGSSVEGITKALNSKKNQKILPQLYDILGYVQTANAHAAVMKKLHFDEQSQEDNSERYLWSSSLSTQPNPEIISDLLNKYKKTQNIPKKVGETLLLSIASMTYRLSKLPNKPGNSKVINTIKETIVNNLDAAKDEERLPFLRALRNLKLSTTIPKLLEIVKTGNSKEGVLAWKAIRAMEPSSWSKEVLSAAYRTYYQLDKNHDSSSRTLAADVILESNPSDEILKGFLYYFLTIDKQFEVRQYVFQQIKMMSEQNPLFKKRILRLIRSDTKLNNYSTLSPRGLSISLRRNFLETPSSNGSLLTVQEMSSGIVKRGIVNVMMDKNGQNQEIFSLGIFSGGLGSFLSSDADTNEEETATAGMELSILGTQIRPFTFFEGQGELMGHVWSGTASDRTTAFQALILLQDHQEVLRLGTGFIIDLNMKGAASFDLAGKVEFSLWSRNAQSLIEKSVGFVGIGTMKLESPFIDLGVEYKMAIEPNLRLNSDIDFSSDVSLCLRLSQPESTFRYNVYKTERVPGSKHTISRTKQTKVLIPGRTYALNKKNNLMCGEMFK